jgi:tRNA (guanine10-N2)-dimethyltransferase
VAKLFFLLSGESESLPAAEVKAILEAEGYRYANAEVLDQVLRLEAELGSVQTVQVRSAYTRVGALELFVSNANLTDIAKAASETDFKAVLKVGESFAVRINRIKNYADEALNTMVLEGKLGRQILNGTEGTKVSLKNPDKTFLGIITNEKLVLGLKLTDITSKTFSERRPRKKPFFHPSAMPSKMARCMVNLAHGKAEALVLDPFCGTGTSLIEATYIGCRALGVDAQRRMVLGCRKNLRHFNISPEGLIWADARQLPFFKVDCIVTDPPYGRSSSTLKSTTKQLVQEVLASAYGLLGVGQRICIALPIMGNGEGKTNHMSAEISSLVKKLGYRTIESHKLFVHRTLTREVMVYQKD